MNIKYIPQRPLYDFDFPQYKIKNEIIYIKHNDMIKKIDFSNLEDEKLNSSLDFILSAKKFNGELNLTLIQAVDKNGIPLEYDNDFDVTVYEDTEIDWITQEEIDKNNIPIATVESLKAQLAETDYKIIKCYEYQLAGLELPYDITILHVERQAIRDEINELESVEE